MFDSRKEWTLYPSQYNRFFILSCDRFCYYIIICYLPLFPYSFFPIFIYLYVYIFTFYNENDKREIASALNHNYMCTYRNKLREQITVLLFLSEL